MPYSKGKTSIKLQLLHCKIKPKTHCTKTWCHDKLNVTNKKYLTYVALVFFIFFKYFEIKDKEIVLASQPNDQHDERVWSF